MVDGMLTYFESVFENPGLTPCNLPKGGNNMKMKIWKRLASLVLVLVLVLGMLPMMRMTAYAATEVPGLGQGNISYSDGATQYFKYNNYCYKVMYTNLKDVTQVKITYASAGEKLRLAYGGSSVTLYDSTQSTLNLSKLPKSQGGVLNCYSTYETIVTDKNKPVAIITCVTLSGPAWNWASNNSSATAVFSIDGTDYCVTVNAGMQDAILLCSKWKIPTK